MYIYQLALYTAYLCPYYYLVRFVSAVATQDYFNSALLVLPLYLLYQVTQWHQVLLK